ncbi:MAG: HAMP domain-containing protein [Desulfobacteraceae bacterium]|nr:MAG: HAMP domain-containing protein [Desulfobacteraceae bacterium]
MNQQILAGLFILLCILVAAAASTQISIEKRFSNPVAYAVSGETIYVVEKEGNRVLALDYSPSENRLILQKSFTVEKDDPENYYMVRRLYPGPNGVVVRSWIYDRRTKEFKGYRFRQYPSFSEPPQEILTLFMQEKGRIPDVNYAFDRQGRHYFINNCPGQYNIWQIPPEGKVRITGPEIPPAVRQMGDRNTDISYWAWICIADKGPFYVSSMATERIAMYLPGDEVTRVVGETGFHEGGLLAPYEVFFTRMEPGSPDRLTVASTGNRSWVQLDEDGRSVKTFSALKSGYPFADIYVGRVYTSGKGEIFSFDLANKCLLVHSRNFAAFTTYHSSQPLRAALLFALSAILLLPILFRRRVTALLQRVRFPFFLKLLLLSIPLVVLSSVVVGDQVRKVIKADLEAESVLRSANLSRAVLNSLSLEDLKMVQAPEDRCGPAYERVYATVSRIVDLKVQNTPKWILHKIREGRYYYGINMWRGSIYEPFIVPRDRRMFFNVLLEKAPQHGRFTDEQGEWFSFIAPVLDEKGCPIYVLELYRPTEEMDRSEKDAEMRVVRIVGGTALVATILIFLFSYLFTRPLRRLIQGTNVIKQGNFDCTIQVSSRDEVGTLARAFNEMVSDLKRYTEDLSKAVSAKEMVESRLHMADTIQRSLRKVIEEVMGGTSSEYAFEWLVQHMEGCSYKKGEYLFRKGERAEKIYYLEQGTLRVVEIDQVVTKGAIIGETGILSPMKERTLSIMCDEECVVFSMDEEKARELFFSDPSLVFQLILTSIKRSLTNLKRTVAEMERIEADLRIARDIQVGVLPRSFPAFPERSDFEIFAFMEPAREVGGDFYDFFLVDENKLCFMIGDVSGKGIPAALFMMVTKILLKTMAKGGMSPDEILFNVNNILSPDNDASMFVTVLCAILDTQTGELMIGNAGHNPPLLCRCGEDFEYIALPRSFVLGPMQEIRFPCETLSLRAGDTIFFYTDGVTEAADPTYELFSPERLKHGLDELKGKDAQGIVYGIRDMVRVFASGAPQSDDITMLGVRYFGG